jgi:signal transduction histidine kinase
MKSVAPPSERKGTSGEKSLEEAYAELLSLAVHEFRTPISVVSGYLRMLQRDTESPLNERQRRMISEAERSCAHIGTLIGELSEISKIDSRAVSFATDPIDLFQLIAEVAEGMHESEDRGVRLEAAGERVGAHIMGDAARLRAAFAAVFRAILREQASGTAVVVERRVADEKGRRAAVVVVVPEDRVQAAYDAVRTEFNEKRGGLGLALPIAGRIIRAHGGRISDLEGAGKGAALISMPLTELTP